jgi:hypothetical protein
MQAQSKLIEKFVIFEQDLFTGVITIILNSNYQQWKIYLYQGMLLWAEGGCHVYRFWQRHLNLICPYVNIKLFEQERIISNSTNDYYFINTLLKQKLFSREQIKYSIVQRSEDILFDIFQIEHKHCLKFSSQAKSAHSLLKNDFNFTLSPLTMYQLLSKVYAQWFIWEEKGLTSCSPNLAPILKKDTQIERQVSPIIFQNMQRMLNGKQTLRDLALQMNKDVFEVTCALVPYFFKGYIRLLEIPDLPGVNLPFVIKK